MLSRLLVLLWHDLGKVMTLCCCRGEPLSPLPLLHHEPKNRSSSTHLSFYLGALQNNRTASVLGLHMIPKPLKLR